jgi:hypothetical protein
MSGDERAHVADLLDRLMNASDRDITSKEQEPATPVPVESLRGLEDGICGQEGKIMIVHAAFDEVLHAVKVIRSKGDRQWGIWLVQLRGHHWTIVSAEEPLEEGIVSEDGAAWISQELASDVVFCATEDTSGAIIGCIFREGVPLLKMDNMDGIASQLPTYDAPPHDPDEESDDFEFDVRRHLDHYLRTQGTYLPSIWPKAPPGTGVGVSVQHLDDADFERVEYLASYE